MKKTFFFGTLFLLMAAVILSGCNSNTGKAIAPTTTTYLTKADAVKILNQAKQDSLTMMNQCIVTVGISDTGDKSCTRFNKTCVASYIGFHGVDKNNTAHEENTDYIRVSCSDTTQNYRYKTYGQGAYDSDMGRVVCCSFTPTTSYTPVSTLPEVQ